MNVMILAVVAVIALVVIVVILLRRHRRRCLLPVSYTHLTLPTMAVV